MRPRDPRPRGAAAFTLVELVVVIAVLVVLMAMLIPTVGWFQRQAAKTATEALLAVVAAGVQTYAQDQSTASIGGTAPALRRMDGTAVSAWSANDWDTVRAAGRSLYRELVSTTLDNRSRPRPGYLAGQLPPVAIADAGAEPFLVDRWGNPVIYIAWTGLRSTRGRELWPTRGVSGEHPDGYRLSGNDRGCELWSAGPDGAFGRLTDKTGDDEDAIADPSTTSLLGR
ncbi:MAG: hypothetical protein RLZZ127_1060 [Planctomycetota bacterium]|jgi:type II secretory pathway pseudopilin PulG